LGQHACILCRSRNHSLVTGWYVYLDAKKKMDVM